jgi:hypothetical protein
MIEILGSIGNAERRAADVITEKILSIWPDLRKSDDIVKIYAGAKIFGHQSQDIDVLVFFLFKNPRSFAPIRAINSQPDGEVEKKEIWIESSFFCVEVKSHDARRVKFEGIAAYVNYTRNNSHGWHSVSDQNLSQAHSVKGFISEEIGVSPYVSNLILFENLEEKDLPRRPHNIVSLDITPRDFLTVLAENSRPWKRKNNKVFISLGPIELAEKINHSRLFKTIIPTDLDRVRIDAISLQQGFNASWMDHVGERMLILRGRAGTGKTIALLQLANSLYVKNSSRVLILTYNTALVSDIKRVLALLGLPASLDEGGVAIESSMSFFRKLLITFGMLDKEEDFIKQYGPALIELSAAFNQGIFSREEICKVIDSYPEFFAYDYIFIDESQDWFYDEIKIIRHLYDTKNIIISDGMDQIVRGSRSSWTLGLKEKEKSVFLLDKSLRMKGNLTLFANSFASHLGVKGWSLNTNSSIKGGLVNIFVGDLWSAIPFAKELIEKSINQKNNLIDLLCFTSPNLSSLLMDQDFLNKFKAALGCDVFEGFRADIRRTGALDVNALRVYQYESSRGLEGWLTICFDFDGFYQHRVQRALLDYEGLNDKSLSKDEWVNREVNSWILMTLTRSIDSIFIHLSDEDSDIARKLKSLAISQPDIFVWRS